jgi:superfamily II helicase
MDTIICEHCLQPTTGKVYQVISEDAGVVTLNIVVCTACSREAKKLGLKTNDVDSATRAQLELEFDRSDYRG